MDFGGLNCRLNCSGNNRDRQLAVCGAFGQSLVSVDDALLDIYQLLDRALSIIILN
jgi:hypothetical protein